MKNFNNVIDFSEAITKGSFGISMLSITEPKMRKTNNPFYGRVKKASYMINVALGYKYENVVNNRLKREGLEAAFKSEKPTGKTWEVDGLILHADKDIEKKYLRTTMRPNTVAKVVYLLDERICNEKEEAEIKTFIPTPKPSPKQMASGLSEENEVIVRDFTLDNILALVQGEKTYFKNLEAKVLYEAVKKIL